MVSSLYEYLRWKEPQSEISGKRFFCSRKNHDRISNQSQVKEMFRANGFDIVFPEDISLQEQMAIFKSDNLVVSSSGSIVHNILFGRPNTRFVEIGDQRSSSSPHIMQQLVNSLAVADFQFVPFATEDDKNWDLSTLQKVINSL